MTKPRTKAHEELTAEIKRAEKKIRQFEKKILDRKLAAYVNSNIYTSVL